MADGNTVWVFPDGDLPPPGDREPHGHESLIIVNLTATEAQVSFDIYFEDRPPVKGLTDTVGAERVRCFRMDKPLTAAGYRVPYGQYALVVRSSVPVVVQLGRMDVRQPNLAYYTTMGFPAA